jgi:hypothetical protein
VFNTTTTKTVGDVFVNNRCGILQFFAKFKLLKLLLELKHGSPRCTIPQTFSDKKVVWPE